MATILQFPDVIPDSIDFRLTYVTQGFVSPFGSTTQTAEYPGAKWSARLNFSNLLDAERSDLSAFLVSMRGMAGRFTLYDHSKPEPSLGSKANGTIINSTLAPTRTRVELNNVTNLSVGDYIEVTPTPDGLSYANSYKELKMITDITSNVVTVEPPFRVVPSVADVVVFNNPRAVMMLDSDDQAGWGASKSISLSNISISCTEAY